MFERHAGGERVILVAVDFGDPDFSESVAELRLLASGAGLAILGEVQGKRSRPDAALFVGSGKADEIAALVAATEADVVIFNHELSPAQERNLERRLHVAQTSGRSPLSRGFDRLGRRSRKDGGGTGQGWVIFLEWNEGDGQRDCGATLVQPPYSGVGAA